MHGAECWKIDKRDGNNASSNGFWELDIDDGSGLNML